VSDYTDAVNRTPAPPPVTIKTAIPTTTEYVDAVNREPTPPPVVIPTTITPITTAPKTTTPTKSYVAPVYSPSVAVYDNIQQPTTPQPVAPAPVLPPIVVPTATQEQQIREAQFTEQQIWLATPEGTKAVEAYQEPFIAAAAKVEPQYAVTYTEGGVESTVVFNTKDKAESFAENIREPNIAVSSVKAIPGPVAGAAPGSIGAGLTATLTGALMSTESWFENLAVAMRTASTQQATAGAEAKSLAGLTGGFTAEDATSALFKFGAGVVEGATFALRPKQWAQLASLPVLAAIGAAGAVASGAAVDWRAGSQFLTTPIDPSSEKFIAGGGVLLEVAGAAAGAVFAGKALNAAGKYVKGKISTPTIETPSFKTGYEKSYSFQGERFPADPETGMGLSPDEYALRSGSGKLRTLSYEGTVPRKGVYRYMYSGLPMNEIDELISNFVTNQVARMETPAFKAFTMQITTNPVVSASITGGKGIDPLILATYGGLSNVFNEQDVITRSNIEISKLSKSRVIGLPKLTSGPSLISTQINKQDTEETPAPISVQRTVVYQAVNQMTEQQNVQRIDHLPKQIIEPVIYPIVDPYPDYPYPPFPDDPDPEPDPFPDPDPYPGPDPLPDPPTEETPQGVDVPSKAKGSLPKREVKREPGESLYSVAFTYGRGGETRTVSAKSYPEAYAKAERSRRVGGQPSQVRIVKI
jgi:hypothetical protein